MLKWLKRKKKSQPQNHSSVFFFTIFTTFSLLTAACQAQGTSQSTTVSLQNQAGEAIKVRVEIADTPAKRSHGLMFRKKLAEDSGMLFIFPEKTRTSFWMKDTPIALDMIFSDHDRIIDIIENAVPYSEIVLTPKADYQEVLEVPAGFVQTHHLHTRDILKISAP